MTEERKRQNEKKDGLVSEEQRTMEELPPEQLRKQIEKEKRKAVRSTVFAVAALIALIAICIAWFVSNTRVNGTLGGIRAGMKSVELKTYGGAGVHDDLLKKVMRSEGASGSESFWSYLADAVNGFFETSSDKYAINWLLSDTSNVGNYSAAQSDWEEYWKNPPSGAERQDEAIEPGSSGELTFYVVPNYDGEIDLKMNLSLIPYKEEKTTFTEITDDAIAKGFIDGHILFFLEKVTSTGTGENGTSTEKKEIQWIKDGTFKIEIKDAKEDQEYGYTLYWCWPQTFGEAVLKSGDSYLNGRKILFFGFSNGEAMRNTILQTDDWSMMKNPGHYFYSSLTKSPLSADQEELKQIADMYNKNSGELSEAAKNAFVDLSSYYNQADQYIGSHVDCVRVRLTAE